MLTNAVSMTFPRTSAACKEKWRRFYVSSPCTVRIRCFAILWHPCHAVSASSSSAKAQVFSRICAQLRAGLRSTLLCSGAPPATSLLRTDMVNDRADATKPLSTTRRSFLKYTSMASAAAALPDPPMAHASLQTTAGQEKIAGTITAPVQYVNVLQGTQSTPVFSHGNTLPIAAVPFGMAHWTLQTNAGTPWFFQPWNRRTQGFRCTHQLSPWLYDYGFATFLPVSGKVQSADAPARASSYLPEEARLTPYSLELYLLRYRTRIELVPTERCCIIAADFDTLPPGDVLQVRGFIMDIPSVAGEIQQLKSSRRIQFACDQTSGGTPKGFATYYIVEFDSAWEACETEHHKDRDGADRQVLSAYFTPGKRLQARIATSFISFEQAAYTLEQEIGTSALVFTTTAVSMARWNRASCTPIMATGTCTAHGIHWARFSFPNALPTFCRPGSTRTRKAAGFRSFLLRDTARVCLAVSSTPCSPIPL